MSAWRFIVSLGLVLVMAGCGSSGSGSGSGATTTPSATSPRASAGGLLPDPCTLATEAEMSAIINVPIDSIKPFSDVPSPSPNNYRGCAYLNRTGGSIHVFTLRDTTTNGQQLFDKLRADLVTMLGDTPIDVPGLGDAAFRGQYLLYARKGDVILHLTAGAQYQTSDQAAAALIKVATALLQKI